MKFKVGQVWRDKLGDEMTVEAVCLDPDDEYPVEMDTGRTYTAKGLYFGIEQPRLEDLVELVLDVEDAPQPAIAQAIMPAPSNSNPKTLMGRRKPAMLSVIPPTALIYLSEAMQYGAYEAPRVDGTKGYGPYNWRDQPIEAMIYVDAAMRHLLRFTDGTEIDADSGARELGHAMASIAILVDAIENQTFIDDRPRVRKEVAAKMLTALTQILKEKA